VVYADPSPFKALRSYTEGVYAEPCALRSKGMDTRGGDGIEVTAAEVAQLQRSN